MEHMSTARAVVAMGRFHFLLSGLLLYGLGSLFALAAGAAPASSQVLWGYVVLMFGHLSVSYSNDYFDYETDKKGMQTPFSGGSGTLQRMPGLRPLALHIAWGLIACSVLLGTAFVWHFGFSPAFILAIIGGNLLGTTTRRRRFPSPTGGGANPQRRRRQASWSGYGVCVCWRRMVPRAGGAAPSCRLLRLGLYPHGGTPRQGRRQRRRQTDARCEERKGCCCPYHTRGLYYGYGAYRFHDPRRLVPRRNQKCRCNLAELHPSRGSGTRHSAAPAIKTDVAPHRGDEHERNHRLCAAFRPLSSFSHNLVSAPLFPHRYCPGSRGTSPLGIPSREGCQEP